MTDLLDRQLAAFDRGALGADAFACRFPSPLDLACALDPRFVRTPALELINDALVWADDTPDARLIVVMSPQEGKSLLVSNYGVLWSLIRNPRKRVAITSYGDALARRWGRSVRNLVRTHTRGADTDLGLRLAPDLQAANEWQLTTGGGVVTAGVHTGLTGRPVDDLRIDDPLKDRDEADSPAVRENVWEFWTGTAVPRLAPSAPVTLVMCMTGDTPVLRPDGSETALRDIRPGDPIATYENGRLTTTRVENWVNQGPDAVFAVRMKSGRVVRANARHPFLTIDSEGCEIWVRTGALRPNDRVMCAGALTAASPALSMNAISPRSARACAPPTTTRPDGLLAIDRRHSLQRNGVRYDFVGDMALSQISTIASSSLKGEDAQSVVAPLKRRVNPDIGLMSSASTTTTRLGRCAGCFAMTATSLPEELSPPNVFAPSPTTYRLGFDEVDEVVPAGVEDVYDIQVERTENFIANGLVSHNTRWHHDDLAGRLERAHPGEWRTVHIPAQADPDVVDPDPLGRAPGEYMISARGRTAADWERRKAEMGPDWAPLAQGHPAPPGGDAFDVSKLRRWHWTRDRTGIVCGPRTWRLSGDCWVFVTMDTATSVRTSADWTVASVWAVPVDGSLVLLDVARARVPAHQQIDVARPLVDRWRPDAVYVEPSMRSTQLAREAVAEGWRFRDVVADKDKVRRAAPAARRVQHGEVWWPSGPEGLEADGALLDYIRVEVEQFPNGRHDDFVDTFGYAARVAFTDFVPAGHGEPQTVPGPSPAEVSIGSAVDVPPGFDPSTAQW